MFSGRRSPPRKVTLRTRGGGLVSPCARILFADSSTPPCLQFESPLNRIPAFNVVTLKFHEVSLRISITRPMCVGRSIKICRCRANMGHRSVESPFYESTNFQSIEGET